jgi:alkylhydroperoxidase family enzyme
MTPGELLAVRNWRDADDFSPAARAALAATDQVIDTGAVSAPTLTECERTLGARHLSWHFW